MKIIRVRTREGKNFEFDEENHSINLSDNTVRVLRYNEDFWKATTVLLVPLDMLSYAILTEVADD